ncbi:hypothetical protein CCO03_11115 [Comamonas serinivorans]|uniref:DUF4401 domain-containing protein n=1 Tax=Comamonas serinivorans TaxID=1082851 RepID=A0A1Y0ENI0_9BURK|nr:GDYXXLXY domain-containing protein [Comamonas serinivorans]ARU05167.1 hypothetical protein CCO03_11115 [Comamonas serinivorans]
MNTPHTSPHAGQGLNAPAAAGLRTPMPAWWAQAQAQGWVTGSPSGAASPQDEEPSAWLVGVLMVGALLCMLSAMGLLALLLQDLLISGLAWGLALLLWGASVAVMRAGPALFVQCLAVVGVATGSVWLGVLVGDAAHGPVGWPWLLAGVAQAALLGLTALAVRPRWVQQLCGVAAAAWLVLGVLVALAVSREALLAPWAPVILTGLVLLWGLWMARESAWAASPQGATWAALGEGMADGLLGAVVVLASVLDWLGGSASATVATTASSRQGMAVQALGLGAVVLVFGLALLRRWRGDAVPNTRGARWQPLAGLAVGLATAASAAMPWMAPVALMAASAAMRARWRLLGACGVVALVVLSRFYYALSWSLATKGAVMAGVGLALALVLLALRARWRQVPAAADAARTPAAGRTGHRLGWAGVVLGAVLCLGLVNLDVWRKEQVVQHGEAIWVPLAPVDPRSLMQGDYMDLRFDIPPSVLKDLEAPGMALSSWADVVVTLDARQRATVQRLAQPDEALAANERRMPLKRLKGRWTLVTDAYFFPEGGAKPFEAARLGEFRVLPDGRALLVGLSDANGQPIHAPADLRR